MFSPRQGKRWSDKQQVFCCEACDKGVGEALAQWYVLFCKQLSHFTGTEGLGIAIFSLLENVYIKRRQWFCVYASIWAGACVCITSVQLLSHVRLFATSWTVAHQASLSIINSRHLLKLMSIESVMPSDQLILCCPHVLPSIFPSIRSFLLSQFFASGGQSIGASASVSVLPMNILMCVCTFNFMIRLSSTDLLTIIKEIKILISKEIFFYWL